MGEAKSNAWQNRSPITVYQSHITIARVDPAAPKTKRAFYIVGNSSHGCKRQGCLRLLGQPHFDPLKSWGKLAVGAPAIFFEFVFEENAEDETDNTDDESAQERRQEAFYGETNVKVQSDLPGKVE